MTRIQRRLLIDTSVIGITITMFVAILDFTTRALVPVDDWLYDRRARACQYFTPPPTDKLVHIDIDDQALASIGQWPWPRAQFAQIIDEISDAGAKAIFMDVIFSEPSNPSPRIEKVAPARYVETDDDAIFAASLRRSNKCLVPVALEAIKETSPVFRKMREYLLNDLEISDADCLKLLLADPDKALPPGSRFPADTFVAARIEAMNTRISRELEKGDLTLEQLRARLLPKTDPEAGGSPLLRLLREEYRKVVALQPLSRFMLPIPPGLPPLAKYTGELAPILPFSQAAVASGYVDYLPSESGAVRAIHLWSDYRGQLFPQTDLALACVMLGVDIRTVKVSADTVVIPSPPGRGHDIVIPVRSMYSSRFGREVGMFMDVPVRGTRDWEFLFDHKRFKRAELHLPMSVVWEVGTMRDRIARNNANLDRALYSVLGQDDPEHPEQPPRLTVDPDKWKAYAAAPPKPGDTAARKAMIDFARVQLKETGIIGMLDMKDAEFEKDPRGRIQRDELARALKTFDRVLQQNTRFEEQLSARMRELREKIGGRAVMIGWTATGRTDFIPTAIQPQCPGVVVHGMVFNAIMTESFWRHAPKWVTALITIFLGLIVTAANGFLKPSLAITVAIVLGVSYLLVNGLVLFDYGNICVGVAGPMIAIGSSWATGALAGFLIEATERARITKRFSSYVDPKLVEHVIENPDAVLDGQVREMSVIFTDLAGFTTLSETLRERTVPILSEYLGQMVPIIRQNEGFVNKFLGDGIMCFFNAPDDDPDHAVHAVRTVLQMQVAMAAFADMLVERDLPRVSMRCGVCTGNMVVGDSGPADTADYTVLGDSVNFAARLESANKATGTKILISERTSELLDGKFLLRPVGKLQVVGKTEGVMTFEPLVPIDDATPEQRLVAAASAEMVAAYVARDFARCIQVADRIEQTTGPFKLAALYRRTSQHYVDEPPGADFVGNLILTEK